MKLNLLERFKILKTLPQEGNFSTLKIVRHLQESLSPSEEEYKEFGIKQDGEQLTWTEKGLEEREIDIGEKATDIIIEALEKLDKDGKLTPQHISIYEKFIKNKD